MLPPHARVLDLLEPHPCITNSYAHCHQYQFDIINRLESIHRDSHAQFQDFDTLPLPYVTLCHDE